MKKLTIQTAHELAKKNSGKCISTIYENCDTKLEWICNKYHHFSMSLYTVKKGSWCPKCAGNKRLSIADMRVLAGSFGGECLSSFYKNVHTKLLWQCEFGHKWHAIPLNVKKGKWCPDCAGNKKHNIDEMREIAIKRGGECLSDKYINNITNLKWRCKFGHVWNAMPVKILTGRWCIYCNDSIGERICRAYFEQLFNANFPKKRPNWLINDHGNRLELDGFCEELSLAFEHNGDQHYKKSIFSSTDKKLEKIKRNDLIKKELCRKNNVTLIIIPQIFSKIEIKDLKLFIIKKCIEKQFKLPANINDIDIDLSGIYRKIDSSNKNEQLKEMITSKGGEYLVNYVNSHIKIKIKCKNGHIWSTLPGNIQQGHWCQRCTNSKRID